MNDLSALTQATRRLRVRGDLFSEHRHQDEGRHQSAEWLERCDGCRAVISLYEITFTGDKFLCRRCTGAGSR